MAPKPGLRVGLGRKCTGPRPPKNAVIMKLCERLTSCLRAPIPLEIRCISQSAPQDRSSQAPSHRVDKAVEKLRWELVAASDGIVG
jgi:hypothetical protein